jgi:hypothetical protein
MTAVACAMFNLSDTGFSEIKLLATSSVLALVLRLDSDGINLDTLKDNAIQTAIMAILLFVAFVE